MGRRTFRTLGCAIAALMALASCADAQQGTCVLPDLFAPFTLAQNPVLQDPQFPPDVPAPLKSPVISPHTGMPRFDAAQEGGNIGIIHLALESGQYIDPRYIANSQHPDDPGLWEVFHDGYADQIHRLVQDYKNFYLSENMFYVGVAVAIAAPLANTHADQSIRDWYQRGAGNGQSHFADQTANVFRQVGEYQYAVPIYFAFSLTGFLCDETPALVTVGEFGNRSLRALAVGAPTVGVLQYALGSDRPSAQDSHWQPFQSDHGVSGHAFVGAVPFLTAASMCDNPALKTLLVLGSFGPAWSRIHTDDHYFSQVMLGWSIAYLSVQSVSQTESQFGRFHIVPCDIPRGVGMGVQIEY